MPILIYFGRPRYEKFGSFDLFYCYGPFGIFCKYRVVRDCVDRHLQTYIHMYIWYTYLVYLVYFNTKYVNFESSLIGELWVVRSKPTTVQVGIFS
jgi:hypothetical protein